MRRVYSEAQGTAAVLGNGLDLCKNFYYLWLEEIKKSKFTVEDLSPLSQDGDNFHREVENPLLRTKIVLPL